MLREEGERLVAQGVACWEGSTLVFLHPPFPLTSGGQVLPGPAASPLRITWPGWDRASDGTWTRVESPSGEGV